MLTEILRKYLAAFPEERDKLQLLLEQIDDTERSLSDRKNFRGHITGDAIVLSPDKRKILLIHHKFLNRWLQPGGHWDSGELDPLQAARREAYEETSVELEKQLAIVPDSPLVPLHILGSAAIPPSTEKDEPAHYHHGFFYVFVAEKGSLTHQQEEVHEAAWVSLTDDKRLEPDTFVCIISKLKRFHFI